jgi:acetylornithine deacetylase/succinyl-diaminopimelate desuccinylase-like protein
VVTAFIRFKREGYRPDRDIILALTADEEGGKSNGVDWLLRNHRDLVDAEFALNPDAGGVTSVNGKAVDVDIEASEKLYADFQLTATNPGGHSSLPVPDNAIYHIADALSRLERAPFPFELNEVTRTYFERRANLETGQTAEDMRAIFRTPPDEAAIARLSRDARYNSTMRTTCVATRLSAGHANNALPQLAQANVNCRILPGHSAEEIRQKLIAIFADPQVTVRFVDNSYNVSRPRARQEGVSAHLARARDTTAAGTGGRANVAGSAGDSGHGNGRFRQHLHHRGGHPDLWRERRGHRSGRCPRARQGRAGAHWSRSTMAWSFSTGT